MGGGTLSPRAALATPASCCQPQHSLSLRRTAVQKLMLLHVCGALLDVPWVLWLLGDILHERAAAAAAELPALKCLWHGR